VGQGEAIFIESPTGSQVIIDGGPDGKVLRELSHLMPFYDRSVDMLLVSNPDKDHLAGFIDVLSNYKIGVVLLPGTEPDTEVYRVFSRAALAEGAERRLARRGMEVNLGGGAVLRILFPDRDVSGLSPNDGSIVARLSYGEVDFLFPGDAPKKIENFLAAASPAGLKSEVLKVAHHGSKTSTADAFVAAVAPRFAVISSGKDNRYGHPHGEVLDTLSRFGVEVLRTDSLGTIIIKTDGHSLEIKK
ncbi:MAG: MBL fold metallo-hydrolase, partial [Candidatus Taylorbacteria bacterium]|nr:MBL fold metallo-hydrolase [Candidatus Taylorbacteria bacterium]